MPNRPTPSPTGRPHTVRETLIPRYETVPSSQLRERLDQLRERRLHLALQVLGRLERPLPALPQHCAPRRTEVGGSGRLEAGGWALERCDHRVSDGL